MNYILFDDADSRLKLMPFTLTRPIALIRCGIFTLKEKWEEYLGPVAGYETEDYLQKKYPAATGTDLKINGAVFPADEIAEAVKNLEKGKKLIQGNILIAQSGDGTAGETEFSGEVQALNNVWDIFVLNGKQISADLGLIKKKRKSSDISDHHTVVYGMGDVFLEPGAKVKAAVINAETGPVYLGKDSEVQEGAVIRGPFALCEHGVVNTGAKIRGDSTVGPWSKVGGEVSNSVIFGYSNKSHDGFIGNTVIGEWCNLGADTNTSNLKNNYGPVKVYSYKTGGMENTGRQFCGLMMGDHSKTAINTMLNTGTVVGACANIFGAGFPPKHVPSFSWGGADGFSKFKLEKAYEVAERMMSRRDIAFTDGDKNILDHIFENSD